jgi:hypothetical protein
VGGPAARPLEQIAGRKRSRPLRCAAVCFYFTLAECSESRTACAFSRTSTSVKRHLPDVQDSRHLLGIEITQRRTPAEQHTLGPVRVDQPAVSFPNWAAALPPRFPLLARPVLLVSTPSRPALRLFTRSAHIGQPIARLSAELASRNSTFSFPGPRWMEDPARPPFN